MSVCIDKSRMSKLMQATLARILFIILIHAVAVLTQPADSDIKDYCEFDKWFEPQCDVHQVILINHARYGRMRTGRCIASDSGTMGCSMDARGILGARCSGRRSCQVLIVDIPPTDNPPCPIRLRGYLEVAYDCVNVITPPRGYCQRDDVTEVRDRHGYFASLVAEETGCGTPDSPWWMPVEPGQTLTIRLVTLPGAGSSSSVSKAYATITESGEKNSPPPRRDITDATPVYKSDSTTVKISLFLDDHVNYFLLEFEVTGCPNIRPQENSWQRRNGEELFVGCNDETVAQPQWTLRCEGTDWIGESGECPPVAGKESEAVQQTSSSESWSFITETNALAIIVGIGVAILIGICLLMAGIIYICKHHKHTRRPPSQPVSESQRRRITREFRGSLVKEDDCECDHSDTEYYGTWQHKQHNPKYKQYSEEECSSLDGMPLPPPPPPYTPPCATETYGCNRGDDEHIYERPIFPNRPDNQQRGDERNSKYYELDPDLVGPLNDANA